MAKYKLSNVASDDLIRIHHYGVKKFGITQADKFFDSFFVSGTFSSVYNFLEYLIELKYLLLFYSNILC